MATANFTAQLDVAIGALIVQPGDVLVIGLARERLSMDEVDRYRDKVIERLPGLADVVLIGGCTALAAYRPDGPEARA